MLPPDEVAIETPEQIDLMLEPAGLGSRFVAWVVDWLWKLLALLGATLILLTRRHQRLGDLAAGTMVIRERAPTLLKHDDLVEQLASDQYTFTPDQLSACTPADRQVLRAFFQRYRELKGAVR